MTVKAEFEMLDLRHFSARQLRPLLEQEARLWEQRLRWNYTAATDLLLRYLDSRILPGFVALDRGRICGYTFCVYEGYKAVVGDAFAIDNGVMPALATTQELLHQLLSLLHHSPEVERIESQLLLYNRGEIAQPFNQAGFRAYRRLFMEADLRAVGSDLAAPEDDASWPSFPDDLALQRWVASDYQAAARLIHAAYSGHIDAQINDQYRTLHGSLRFLHNIIRFPGCGVFDPESSWILRDRKSGSLAGLVLCSRVRRDTAHITQLCIAKDYRGKKLGGRLLRRTMQELARQGLESMSLTVTEANETAVKLYQAMNFTRRYEFDAHVHDTSAARKTAGL